MIFLDSYKKLSGDPGIPQVYFLSGPSGYLKTRYQDLLLKKLGLRREALTEIDPVKKLGVGISEMSQPSFFEPLHVFLVPEIDKVKSVKALDSFREFLTGGTLPEGHKVILVSSDSRRLPRNDFFEFLRENVEWVECQDLKESKSEVSRWIKVCMLEKGRNLPEDVVRELAEMYKTDLYGMESEIEKLAYYPDRVTPEILRGITTGNREASLQPLYDMIALQNGPRALQKITDVMELVPLRQVINGIARFLHQLLVTSSMAPNQEENTEIAESLGVNPYYVKKLRASATRFSPFHLTVALNRLARIDTAIREEGDSRPMLQSLVYFLCESPEKMVVTPMSLGSLN